MRRSIRCALGLALIASAGCTDFNSDRTIEVEATGTIWGLAFLDRNGNSTFEQTVDGVVPGVSVRIVPSGAFTPAARVTTAPTGLFGAPNLPVGDYDVIIDVSTVPDSLRLLSASSTTARVTPGDSIPVVLTLSYPIVKVRDAKTTPPGRRVFVEGVTLNAWATYGDSTLHIVDSTGVIRATRVAPSNVTSGQRVRLLGTTDVRDGLPTLTDGGVFVLGSAQTPAPVTLTTGAAATASGGTLDGVLVQINATILGGQANAVLDFVVSVNDGSGLLEVVLDRSTNISLTQLIPGALINVTGLLVPSGKAGEWQLKPRSAVDLVVNIPTATVAQAKLLPIGRLVSIEGVALNSWVTFLDATVHLADSTGSIRAIRVAQVNLFAGNRVRLVGVIGFDSQIVLGSAFTTVTASVLGDGILPLPPLLTTAVAATADAGKKDAALVKIASGIIEDTATVITPGRHPAGDFVVHVNDGSGLLEVMFDRYAPFQLSAFVPGATLDVTGLLVPLPSGLVWRLKPRQASDVVVVR